jgi:hypothetical protein
VAQLSDVAVLGRLAGAADWLEAVASALLAARVAPESGGRRLRLVDGTAVCHPGADRTSWRLHATFDPGAQRLVRLELTDGRGAERLSRFAWAAGDVAVADRYYARPRELRPVVEAGADLVVRTGWNSLRLITPEGEPFGLPAALDAVGEGPAEHAVRVDERRPDGAALPLRLVVARLPADAAGRARRRLREDATKRGRTPDPRSLAAAGFVLLLTSLPPDEFPPARVDCPLRSGGFAKEPEHLRRAGWRRGKSGGGSPPSSRPRRSSGCWTAARGWARSRPSWG